MRALHKRISGKFLPFHAEIGWQAQFFCIYPNTGIDLEQLQKEICKITK